MARPKTPHGRRVTVSVKVSEAEAAAIDKARGKLTRSAYLRSLVTRNHTAKPERIATQAACKHPGVPRKTLCRRCGQFNTA